MISVLRLVETRNLGKSHGDFIWDITDLSIYSQVEAHLGLFCASLPPLRKLFERHIGCLLPSSLFNGSNSNKRGSGSRNVAFGLHTISTGISTGKPQFEMLGDDGSERGILNDDPDEVVKSGGIYKSTHVTQTVAAEGGNG